jgi:hypothetical protein
MKKISLLLFFGIFVLINRSFAQAPVDTTNIYVDTTGQKDLLDIGNRLLKLKPRKYKKNERKQIYFSILPLSTNVPGASKALVTSTTAGFYLGPRKTTYLSTVTFAPYLNLKGRYGIPIHSSVWILDNKYNEQGDTRFLVYPEDTWGLGGGQNENDYELVNYEYIRFYHSLLRRITPYLYVGIGYDLDYYIDINTNGPETLADFTKYAYGTNEHSNSFTSGVTFNLLYDSRQNLLNPIPGAYINAIFRENTSVIGSDNNDQSVYLDFRKYVSLTDLGFKDQLAFWAYYWTALGSGTPYLNLPAIGMDPYQRSGRGIEQGRYRGTALLYFESEYRRDITANGLLGFVIFGNVNSVSQITSHQFHYFNPAGGTGLRIKFNKKSDTNICIDYGVSKDYSDISIALGEAF